MMTPPAFDAYAEYSQWYAGHYGYPFPITREQWQRWCQAPRRKAEMTDFDITQEQHEGWAYDHN